MEVADSSTCESEMEVADSSEDFTSRELKVLSSHMHTQTKPPNDIELLKKQIREKLLVLSETIEPCTSLEALQQLNKQINAAQNLFSSAQRHPCHHKLEPITNALANKKIEKQRKFRSTRKTTRAVNRRRFIKPSTEDICSLFSQIQHSSHLIITLYLTHQQHHSLKRYHVRTKHITKIF